MITLTSKFLEESWSSLKEKSYLPIELYEWDDGDAYIIKSIGIIPSQKITYAALAFEDIEVTDFDFIIRVIKAKSEKAVNYQAADGSKYFLIGEQNGGLKKINVQVVELTKELASRNALIETSLLKNCCIVIIGLGTGGIQIALELAKAGVGKFKLIDPDRLEAGNTSRHNAGVSFIGRKKVLAGRDLILEKNPETVVETYPIKAEIGQKSFLSSLVTNSDLVICATDNRPSKLLMNSICFETKKTIIFGGAFRRAYGGHVFRVRPVESACFHCLVLAMPDTEADQEISSEENAEEVAYSDKPTPVEPGLSMDVAPIGIMVAKLALQELIRNKKSTLHILDKDFEANWYLWINRPEPGTKYSSWPPLSESSDEMTILRWYGVYLEKDPSCPTCGDFEKSLKEQYHLKTDTVQPIESFPEDLDK